MQLRCDIRARSVAGEGRNAKLGGAPSGPCRRGAAEALTEIKAQAAGVA
jgi:hypothetical protein